MDIFGRPVTGLMMMWMDITGYPESGYVRRWLAIYGPLVIGAMQVVSMDGMPVTGVRISVSMAG